MSLILEAITQHGVVASPTASAPHGVALAQGDIVGVRCEGSKFHSPTPLTCTPVDLRDLVDGDDGPPVDPVHLCGVCLANLRIFVRLMVATDGDLEWEVRREFGNRIRDLGMKAWAYHGGQRG